MSVSKVNALPIEEIKLIKEKYDAFANEIKYDFFDQHIKNFVEANKDRYNYITEEAVSFIQKYENKYAIEDMMVSFSGG